MKKVFLIVLICLVFSFVSSCGYVDESISLAVCASYSIPGMQSYDLKGRETNVRLLEADSEGRSLFEYTVLNRFTGEMETALAVCQRYTDTSVYYYEDVNFHLGDYSEDDVDDLKARNDWNQPYDDAKSTTRKIKVSFDLVNMSYGELDSKKVSSAVSTELNSSDGEIEDLFFFDMNGSEQSIYCLVTADDASSYFWLAYVDDSYSVSLMRLDEDASLADQLRAFKESVGWVYR